MTKLKHLHLQSLAELPNDVAKTYPYLDFIDQFPEWDVYVSHLRPGMLVGTDRSGRPVCSIKVERGKRAANE
jgi:hypothetical protein